ncbi:MAG TPA: DinB family protein [Chitinophaga sp.]|uniref:DinB family protein n=1 Tax=Chitinophaga sp. TaxID=1869181 RepID=UPI002BBD679A|nr:DinB family protein [Chitinophaga sp.]HVI47720.1 DinB family protein [Chitinophaga sp.]
MDKQELLIEVENTSAELLKLFSSLDEEQLNKVPFEGSWTAGQLAEHLIKATSAGLLYTSTTPTIRQPDEKLEPIRNLFMNFDVKFESPDFIRPTSTYHKKDEVEQTLQSRWNEMQQAAETLDLTATCTGFDLPGFGQLTRMELIGFAAIHTQRHIRQLRNIISKVKATPSLQP